MDIIDKLTSLMDGLDIAKLVPDLDVLLGKLEPLVRILILVGPIAMLGLGLYYFFAAPKEANYSAGYRFRYAMSRVEVWRFTQRLAGLVYGSLGLLLGLVMGLLSIRLGKLAAPDMVWFALKCLLWELVPTLIATLGINITVIVLYTGKGDRRDFPKKNKE